MPKPRVITIDKGAIPRREAAQAARALRRGHVVALPTDTVYGLCCRASSSEAREQIMTLKGRDPAKPLPFLIADQTEIFNFVNEAPTPARKLMARFWPGALTLVLGDDPGVALRLPDHEFTREVLRRAGSPVHGTSANLSGEPPALTASAVAEVFGDGLALIVDEGSPAPGAASSIVRVSPDSSWSILREGGVGTDDISQTLLVTLVTVCTGNTCRSPMAAAVLAFLLARELGTQPDRLGDHGVQVLSAGVAAGPGSPMTLEARAALESMGIPVPDHRSSPFLTEVHARADLILAMTPSHVATLRDAHPEIADSIRLLDTDGAGISDPIGGDREVYEDCLSMIQSALEERLAELRSLIPPTDRGPAPV